MEELGCEHGVPGVPAWDQSALSLSLSSREWTISGASKAQEGNSVGKGPTFDWESASRSLVFITVVFMKAKNRKDLNV